MYTGFVQRGLPRSSPKNAAAPLYDQIPDMTSDALANCNCVTHATNRFETCPLQTTSFQPNIWSDIAKSLPHFSHDCWTPTDPAAWTPDDPQHIAKQYECICGKNFHTAQRLQWHVNRTHPPGEIHSATLRNLPRIGGAYIIYHEDTHAVLLSLSVLKPAQRSGARRAGYQVKTGGRHARKSR